jgi:multiple sugar transport system substrate-binding protein
MGLLYRADIFDEHKLTVPETWADFAETSKKLAKDKPGSYLSNFGVDPGWIGAVLWQAGARPFHVDGTNIRININDPIAKKWADYWQALLDAKAANTMPMWTSEWFAAFDDGTNVTWITAAWGPAVMSGSMKASVGKWRAAGIPQWNKGDKISSNWGGSTFGAFTTTPHLKEATEFAMFMGGDPETSRYWNQKQFFFPVVKDLVVDQELMGTKYDFYGGQAVNLVFAEAANQVDPSYEFAPFQDYVNAQLQDELNAAVGGKGTLSEAFDRVQATVVAYATDQGYTVT